VTNMDKLTQHLTKNGMKIHPVKQHEYEHYHSFIYEVDGLTYFLTLRTYLNICFVHCETLIFNNFNWMKNIFFIKKFIREMERVAKQWNCKSIVYTMHHDIKTEKLEKKLVLHLGKLNYERIQENSNLTFIHTGFIRGFFNSYKKSNVVFYQEIEKGYMQILNAFISDFFEAIEKQFKQKITIVIEGRKILDFENNSKIAINLIYMGIDHTIALDVNENQFCIKYNDSDFITDVNSDNLSGKIEEMYHSILNLHRLNNIFKPSTYHFRNFFMKHVTEDEAIMNDSLIRLKSILNVNEDELEERIVQDYTGLVAEIYRTQNTIEAKYSGCGEIEIFSLFGLRFMLHDNDEKVSLYICQNENEVQESFEKIKLHCLANESKKINDDFVLMRQIYEEEFIKSQSN
jgi:hypothetical protein